MRVVSLLAGGTEMVCALGAGDWLVGRSHECDNPDWVRKLPACTSPAFDVNASSGAIDAEVRRRLKAHEPLYHVDSALIQQLKPDVLIAQAHCQVCAVTPADVERAGAAPLAGRIVALHAGSVAGIYEDIATVAAALGRPQAGQELVAQMQERIAAVTRSVRRLLMSTVVMLEWTDPPYSMGNWGPELVNAANGLALLTEAAAHSHAISWDTVRAADPDYLIIAPCGFDLPRTRLELPSLRSLPGWKNLRAVKNGRVALADGNRYFNRAGTSIVETAEIIAGILHGYDAPSETSKQAWEWAERG